MRSPALASVLMVLAGSAMASCSTPSIPGDRLALDIRDPTAAVEAQADPNAVPGVNSRIPIVPQP